MRSADRTTTLLGRRGERERLTQLVHSIQPGQSQVLVLCGGLGVGKTALLRYLHDTAAGCHVARSAGVGPELELAYSALHQLCGPLNQVVRLPDPSTARTGSPFRGPRGRAPDRFTIGLAVLGLLSEAADNSARAPSNGTCARCSASSASSRARSLPTRWARRTRADWEPES